MRQQLQGFGSIQEAYGSGYAEGCRVGACRAVTDIIPLADTRRHDVKLLYIEQGFESIDAGIRDAMQSLVRECVTAAPDDMVNTAEREQPDILLVMNGLHVFPDDFTSRIGQISDMGITTAIWFVDDPYFTEDTARLCLHFDQVFTHELSCVELYRSLGVKTHYMPLAVHPGLFAPQRTEPHYHSDICFVGNAFRNRAALFDELAPFLAKKKLRIIGGFWERLSRYKLLSPFIHSGFIPPSETVKFYNGAKIVINLHRPAEKGEDNRNSLNLPGRSINPRTFEINACGTLQLTDVREDLTRYYKPGTDIETFRDADELKRKLDYYLHHETERKAIALRGLRTTMSRHTYVRRLPDLLRLLNARQAVTIKKRQGE